MHAAYVAVTLVAAVLTGGAAVFNLIGHRYPRGEADRLGVPRSWIPVLGTLLGAGAAGLLAGFALPVVGVLAAGGLVLYFLAALGAHLRVRDGKVAFWAVYFSSSAAALVLNVAR